MEYAVEHGFNPEWMNKKAKKAKESEVANMVQSSLQEMLVSRKRRGAEPREEITLRGEHAPPEGTTPRFGGLRPAGGDHAPLEGTTLRVRGPRPAEGDTAPSEEAEPIEGFTLGGEHAPLRGDHEA